MCIQWKPIFGTVFSAWVLFSSPQTGNTQERAPVPDAAAEHAAKKAAGEIYGGRFALAQTADDKTALAEEIVAAGLKFQAGSADQYALLNIAREIAAGAGDTRIALSAARELAKRFDLQGLELESDTLLMTARWARITTQRTALAEAAGEVIQRLAEADEYERAIRLCEAAQEAAEQAREFKLARHFSNWLPELTSAQQQFQQYRDALTVLNDDPIEPQANFTVGRYLCFVQGDWERGVAMLALGSDEPLKNVAVMELRGAETADEQRAIGDAWWDVAEATEGQERDLLRLRAGSWYRRAVPHLADLAALRVKQRLEEIAKLDRKTSPAPPRPSSSAPPLAIAPFDENTAKEHQAAWAEHLGVPVVWKNSIGMAFVLIPPGEFLMGSPDSDGAARDDEKPQHQVRITRAFYLGIFEVTLAEYERVMGTNPTKFKDNPQRAVDRVNWNDAVEFCRRLSSFEAKRLTRRVYRLPTEAEWEYACRAGTTTTWYSGDNEAGLIDVAWYRRNAGRGGPRPVGQKKPNAWGLHDMHGNVWEWCQDWWGANYYKTSPSEDPMGPRSGSNRVIRGGCFWLSASSSRSAFRNSSDPGRNGDRLGFRLVITVP